MGADNWTRLITDTSYEVFNANSAVSHGFEYGACGDAYVGDYAMDTKDVIIGSFAHLSHGKICKVMLDTSKDADAPAHDT